MINTIHDISPPAENCTLAVTTIQVEMEQKIRPHIFLFECNLNFIAPVQ